MQQAETEEQKAVPWGSSHLPPPYHVFPQSSASFSALSAAEANKEDATDSLHSPDLSPGWTTRAINETEVLWKIHTAIIELQRQYHKSETWGEKQGHRDTLHSGIP